MPRQLIVDGVTVPVWSSTDFTQVIEPVEAVYQSRKKNGGLVQRTLYTGKLRTTIDGGGLAPAGLDDINTCFENVLAGNKVARQVIRF